MQRHIFHPSLEVLLPIPPCYMAAVVVVVDHFYAAYSEEAHACGSRLSGLTMTHKVFASMRFRNEATGVLGNLHEALLLREELAKRGIELVIPQRRRARDAPIADVLFEDMQSCSAFLAFGG